jgi:biopolymer transport protein TolQ
MESMNLYKILITAPIVIQVVIGILMWLSLYSWGLIFKKISKINNAKKDLIKFEKLFWGGADIEQLYEDIQRSNKKTGIDRIFRIGFNEFKSFQYRTNDNEKMLEIIRGNFNVEIEKEEQRLSDSTSTLGTISSTAPFIGLFGTVVGILMAFWGLGMAQQATMATVAPSIAEALIATALGLFVAIPAQVSFNRFNIMTIDIVDSYYTISKEMINIINRINLNAISMKKNKLQQQSRQPQPQPQSRQPQPQPQPQPRQSVNPLTRNSQSTINTQPNTNRQRQPQ